MKFNRSLMSIRRPSIFLESVLYTVALVLWKTRWTSEVVAIDWSSLQSQPTWSTWTLVTEATSLSNKSVLSPWTLSSWKQNPLQSNLSAVCLPQVGWVTRLPDVDNDIWSPNWHSSDILSSMSSERVLAETCLGLNLSPCLARCNLPTEFS